MTIQEKIAAILDAPVFGGELYYIQHPDAAAMAGTYAVFSIVGGQTFVGLDGDSGVTQPRVQMSVYAIDATDLIAKVAAVNAAMLTSNDLAATDTDALRNYPASVPVDGFEQETRRYYSHMDFYCCN